MSEQRISALLLELGVPAHLLGYGYLLEAVQLAGEHPRKVTKELYPMVAQRCGSTPSRVERAIRHAIEVSWLRSDPETQQKYFGASVNPETGKPTNAQYIATLAKHLEMEGA